MATLSTLVVRLTADAGDMNRGLDDAASRARNFASRVGNALKMVGATAAVGLAAATTAVVGLGAGIAKLAIDAAPLVEVQSAFEGLAQSADMGADEMLDALQRGSAGMIAQRDLMLTFNKAAQLVSTDFAVQLPDAMQYLGKVAASTGQDMGFLLDSLVTGVGRLSPMILDNLSIQVSLADATARASEMFGIEADELTKAQVQAGMMNVVMERLAENTANMPDVTEGAAAGIARMRARIQDTKDAIGLAFVPVLLSLMDAGQPLIDTLLPMLVTWLGALAEKVLPVVEAIGKFINRLVEGENPLTAFRILLYGLFPDELAMRISRGITSIIAKAQELGAQGQAALQPLISWLQANLPIAFAALSAAWTNVLQPALQGLVSFFQDVIVPILQRAGENLQIHLIAGMAVLAVLALAVVAPFLLLGAALIALGYIWNQYGEQVKVTWQQIQAIILYGLLQVSNGIREFVSNFISTWQANFEMAGIIVEALRGKVVAAFDGIRSAIQDVIGKVQDFIAKIQAVELPDFLTPGSPTPFELGLLGIASAMDELTRASLPAFGAGLGGMAAPAMAGVGAGPVVGGGGGFGGGLTINIYESESPEATAEAVIRALRDRGLLPQTSYR